MIRGIRYEPDIRTKERIVRAPVLPDTVARSQSCEEGGVPLHPGGPLFPFNARCNGGNAMSKSSVEFRHVLEAPVAAVVEQLEERRLLSGVSLSRGGTLYVEGSRGDDELYVRRDASNKGMVRVSVNGNDSSLRMKKVKRIVVAAGRGDDYCVVNKEVAKRALMQGGLGDDSLYGGSADDSLMGHGGNDSCHGGGGDDSIEGGTGVDSVYGSDGDDSCKGGIGEDDSVRGGRGDDAYDDPKDVDDDDDNDRHRRRRGRGGRGGGEDDGGGNGGGG